MDNKFTNGFSGNENPKGLLSPLTIWGLSLGCAVGWGAFMVPANLFIPTAGPMGTVLAMVLSTVLLLIIAANFCHLAKRYNDDGGIISYTRSILGSDHAFLTGWIVIIAYLSIMWANATATVLLSRFLLGDVLAWGYMYTIAGFDINLGEILFTWLVFIIFGLFSCYGGALRRILNTLMAVVFFLTVVMLFVALYTHTPVGVFEPPFQENTSPFMQVFSMVMLAPWMFFGFEAVTHNRSHFNFSVKKLFPILVAAVVAGGIIYVLLAAMAVMAIPGEFSSWTDYLAQKNHLEGIKALPVFNSVYSTFGEQGLAMLCMSIICAISTSLLGLYRITGIIVHYIGQREIFPECFKRKTSDGTPRNAILLVMVVSLLIPFLGRVSVVWLCDVITVVGSVAYGYASLCSYIVSKREMDKRGQWLGGIGVAISLLFFFFPLIPGILLGGSLDTESYLMLSGWSLLGFIYYWYVFKHDKQNRFGNSTSMVIIVLFLNFFSTSLWLRQKIEHNLMVLAYDNDSLSYSDFATENLVDNSMVQMAMILIILLLMADIFITIKRREQSTAQARQLQHEINQAKNKFLSGLSHDIRIPMEAAQNSVNMALENCALCAGCPEDDCPRRIPDRLVDCLGKLDVQSNKLMGFIDNMVEKGNVTDDTKVDKVSLNECPVDLQETLQQTKELFALQMQEKNLFFEVYPTELSHPMVICDKIRLERLLINLLSNAYEYNRAGGGVMVTLEETGTSNESATGKKILCGNYELRIQDTGIDIPPVVADSLMETYEADSTDMGGLYIARGIVQLMDGTIEVASTPDQPGKEIIIKLTLPVAQ